VLSWFVLLQPAVKTAANVSAQAYVDLLRRKDIVAVGAGSALMGASLAVFITYAPTWLERSFAATADDVALIFLIGGAVNVFVTPMSGALSDRVGRIPILVGSSLFLAAAMSLAPQLTTYGVVVGVLVGVMGGVGIRVAPLNTLATGLAEPDKRGAFMSLLVALSQGGFAVGAGLAGVVFTSGGMGAIGWVSAALSAVCGVVIAIWVSDVALEPDVAPT